MEIATTITVDEAAESPDLVSLAVLKRELGITTTTDDAVLKQRITQASEFINTFFDRTFALETVTEKIRSAGPFWGIGKAGIMLSRFPVIEILAVFEDGTEIEESDYSLEPTNGMLYRVTNSTLSRWRACNVEVQYSAGYEIDTVPADLARAVISLVQQFSSSSGRDPFVRGMTIGPMSEQYQVRGIGIDGVPAELVALKAKYRRITV